MKDITTQAPETQDAPIEPNLEGIQVPDAAAAKSIDEILGLSSLSELVAYIKALIYGDPGAGKTWLGGTAEDHGLTAPVLFIDIDGGLMTIRHRKLIKIKSLRSIAELDALYMSLHKMIDPVANTFPFGTVIVDNLSELQKLDMKEIMEKAPAVVEGRQDKSVPSQREWGISIDHMRKIVRAFRDLPCNVIFLAHNKPAIDGKNRRCNGPDLPGQLRHQIAGFVDVVGYLYPAQSKDGSIERKLQVVPTETTIGKDRSSCLGDVITNPTIPMIWDLIHEGEIAA